MATLKKTAAAPPAPEQAAQVTFRDTVYTSRVLILPKNRQLAVARGQVSVSADDADALAYLDAHADLKRSQE